MPLSPPVPIPDVADMLEPVIDRDARPGDVIPALARLLRSLRDRERAPERPAVRNGDKEGP